MLDTAKDMETAIDAFRRVEMFIKGININNHSGTLQMLEDDIEGALIIMDRTRKRLATLEEKDATTKTKHAYTVTEEDA